MIDVFEQRRDRPELGIDEPRKAEPRRRVIPPRTVRVLLAVVASCLVLACGFAAAAERTRPNVVLLIADDLGYGEPGCYGGDLPTPHVDALAEGGVRFTNGYVTAPYCAASRAGLMTGRYQTRFGFEFNPIGAKNEEPGIGLPLSERTIGDAMKDAGYVTALIGKWHLGGTAAFHPQRRGFDEFFGFLHEGHYFVPSPWPGVTTWLRRKRLPDGSTGRWTSPDGKLVYSTHMGHDEPDYNANNPIRRNGQPVDEREHLTDAITREAVRFVDRYRAQPFLLVVSYNAVHSPMQGADAYTSRFAHVDDVHRRIFAAMLVHMDDSIGEIVGAVGERGLDEDTLFVFLSDNGGPTRELTSSNAPLRGGKGQVYEGGLRVPFIARWKGRLPAGRVDDRPVSSLDVLPTALAAAEIAPPKNVPLDGVDLLPYLTGENDGRPHETLFWRLGTKTAVRRGDWKLLRNPGGGNRKGEWELYDLAKDVDESDDLAESKPGVHRELLDAWKRLDAEMVEPAW